MNRISNPPLAWIFLLTAVLPACAGDESDVDDRARVFTGSTIIEPSGLSSDFVHSAPAERPTRSAITQIIERGGIGEHISALKDNFLENKSSGSNAPTDWSTFAPSEGPVESELFWSQDSCSFGDGPPDNAMMGIPSIANVDPEEKTYTLRFTFENDDYVRDIPCQYQGNFYSCVEPDQVIDFSFFGLDAVFTVTNLWSGLWVNPTVFSEFQANTFSCTGSDCGVPPALDFLGTLAQVPCESYTLSFSSIAS